MYALTFNGIKNIQYEQIPDPELQSATDAIVRTECCAICGSDLHIYHGRESGLDHHTAMGHEFAGEVIEIGKDVKNLRPGDKVVSPFTTACGTCFYCLKGLSARCIHNQIYGWREQGQGLQGAQAEYVRVPMADTTLMSYESFGLSDAEALLAGDILSTGYYGAQLCTIQTDDTIVVIGCGPVGLMAVFSALQLGAKQVIALDSVPYRLDMAQSFGAQAININDLPIARIKELTQGRGADAVIEAVGNESAQQLAFDAVRPGGIISTIGVHTTDSFVFKPADVYNKNISYKSGRCPARSLMPITLSLISKHKNVLSTLYTHHLRLDQGKDAYTIFDNKSEQCVKILLRP